MNEKTKNKILFDDLFYSLVDKLYDYSCCSITTISISRTLSIVLDDLNKMPLDERLSVIISIISRVEVEIKRQADCDQILRILPSLTYGFSTIYKFRNIKDLEFKKEIGAYMKKNEREDILLSIDRTYEVFRDCDREELSALEEIYTNKIKESSKLLGSYKAYGEIIGSLNRGMYGTTKTNMIKELKEAGAKDKDSKSFEDYLPDNLYRFRVIGLLCVSRECAHQIENYNPNTGFNPYRYNFLRGKILHMGEALKEVYTDLYGVSPKQEIVSEILDTQQVIPGIFPEMDNYLTKVRKKSKK